MTPHKKQNGPFTRGIVEDMLIRHEATQTIDAYTYHTRSFTDVIKVVRSFQLYLIQVTHLPDGVVIDRPPVHRSGPSADPRHRLRSDDDSSRQQEA